MAEKIVTEYEVSTQKSIDNLNALSGKLSEVEKQSIALKKQEEEALKKVLTEEQKRQKQLQANADAYKFLGGEVAKVSTFFDKYNNGANNTIANLKTTIGLLKEQLAATAIGTAEFSKLSQQIQTSETRLKSLSTSFKPVQQSIVKTTSNFNGLSNSVAQIGREIPNFALNAQTGFLAISNNLPILFDNLQRVREENLALAASGQKTTSVFKQVVSSIFSLNTALTLIITLSVLYGKELGNLISSLFKGSNAFDEAKTKLEALNAAYDSKELKNGIKNVLQLEVSINQARQGLISQEVVLKQYNETLGVSFGKVNDLTAAEKGLQDNTQAYITALIQRASANKILDDAVQTNIDLIRKRQELDDEEKGLNKSLFQQFREGVAIGQQITDKGIEDAKAKRANSIKEEIKDLENKQKEQIKLINNFNSQANSVLNDNGGLATGTIQSAFQALQSELSKTEDEFKSAKLKGLDTTEIEAKFNRLTKEIEKVKSAFDELTGEAAKKRSKELEDTINKAIADAERASSEANRIGAIDLKNRLAESKALADARIKDSRQVDENIKNALQSELLANERLFFSLKEGKNLNSLQLLEIDQKELEAKISILEAFKDVDESVGKALLDAYKEREKIKTGITKEESQKRAEFERIAIQGALGLAATFEQELFQSREANLRNETSIQLEELEKQKENRTISEQQFNQKKSQLLNDQAQKQRELDLAQIKVQTALSIIRTFAQFGFTPAGFLAATFAAAEGALQYSFAASQPLPRFAKGTERVKGGIKGQDSVHALLMPDEAVIPAKENLARPNLAKAWISGNLDNFLAMNYIRPAIEANNRAWENNIKINQNSSFVRNDNFNDKRIVSGLERINRKLNTTTEKVVYKRNRRLWN